MDKLENPRRLTWGGVWRMKFSSKVAAYNQLLQLGRDREDAILLDIGCCCKLSCVESNELLTKFVSR